MPRRDQSISDATFASGAKTGLSGGALITSLYSDEYLLDEGNITKIGHLITLAATISVITTTANNKTSTTATTSTHLNY